MHLNQHIWINASEWIHMSRHIWISTYIGINTSETTHRTPYIWIHTLASMHLKQYIWRNASVSVHWINTPESILFWQLTPKVSMHQSPGPWPRHERTVQAGRGRWVQSAFVRSPLQQAGHVEVHGIFVIMNWIALHCIELIYIDLHWFQLNRLEFNGITVNWNQLHWIQSNRI